MAKNKKDILHSNKWSLLDLPKDLLRLPENKSNEVSIMSVVPQNDAIKMMWKLSKTCKPFHAFFKPELEKRGKELLDHVLQGTIEDIEKVRAAAQDNPELFFIKATSQDGAMDLEGNRRTIKGWSPYQALFGTGDVGMLVVVKQDLDAYLDTLREGHEMAESQVKEKFPNGFAFPKSEFDFTALDEAISDDPKLIRWGIPSQNTIAALEQFKKYFKPGIVTMGHHFNMNELFKAIDVYHDRFSYSFKWNNRQLEFFVKFVIGFLERLMTRYYLTYACRELEYKHTLSLDRHIWVKPLEAIDGSWAPLVVVPLDKNPSCRLGNDFYIDSYWGNAQSTFPVWMEAEQCGRKQCKENAKLLKKLMRQSNQAKKTCTIM